MLSRGQRKVGKAILAAVQHRARHHGWSRRRARQVGRMCIMCALTESELRVYANEGNAESRRLLAEFARQGYATAIGSDHASVGPFQQQVPGWGDTADCMDPAKSTWKFLGALADKGADAFHKPFGTYPDLADRIQSVQVSAFADGSNYRANRWRSQRFMFFHWNYLTRSVK